MNDLAIEIRDLHKSYSRGWSSREAVEAVQGVSLEVRSGEIWAMAGPNGAGKTTTLHCLLGLLSPDRGEIRVFGKDPRNPEARIPLGFQSEIFFSYAYRRAEDVLRFYGRLSGLKDPDLQRQVDRVLDVLGLASVRGQLLGSFSKGMMQRIGLAQSLLHNPNLIIWDEPSTGLDPEGRRLVADLANDFKAQGKTVLLSTHILSDIERACDHIVIMNKGRVLLSTEMESLLQRHPGKTLEDIYLETVKGPENAR
jgi:ABC-2 type transport system ATP-binding protein